MALAICATLTLFALVLSTVLARRFCTPGSRLHILDHPNERSLHHRPTPRTGGVALLTGLYFSGTIACAAFPVTAQTTWTAFAALLVAGVSFLDDRTSVHPGYRIAVHVLAAVMVLHGGSTLGVVPLPGAEWALTPLLGYFVSLLFVVWMINLYNFMDGMDGFAGGMAVAGFGAFALMGLLAGDLVFALLNLLVVGAALGFLRYNFPPARIFMGDAGASTLGLLAAAFALRAHDAGLFPLWLAVLVFSPFVVDATVTLLRRVLRGERFLRAHRSHYYQRLVSLGWDHRRTVLAEYALMAGAGVTAVAVNQFGTPWTQGAALLSWAACYLLLALGVRRMERGGAVAAP